MKKQISTVSKCRRFWKKFRGDRRWAHMPSNTPMKSTTTNTHTPSNPDLWTESRTDLETSTTKRSKKIPTLGLNNTTLRITVSEAMGRNQSPVGALSWVRVSVSLTGTTRKDKGLILTTQQRIGKKTVIFSTCRENGSDWIDFLYFT